MMAIQEAKKLFERGLECMQAGELHASEDCFRQCLNLWPDFAAGHANLALLLDWGRKDDEAEAHYQMALQLDPQQHQNALNYACLLSRLKRFLEAEAQYRALLQRASSMPQAWSHLGALLASWHQEAEAEACLRTALQLNPDYGNASFNLAYVLLRQGRWEEGWHYLEARPWLRPLQQYLRFSHWQGESLEGKTILIAPEGGYGDMIQFCRYAHLLKRQGARKVSILGHTALLSLLMTAEGVDEVIPAHAPIDFSCWDYWVALLSLPRLFHTSPINVPALIPYFSVPESWREKVAGYLQTEDQCLRLGLVWKGNPDFENDADRSLPSLDALAPLKGLPSIRFYSLQKGAAENEGCKLPSEWQGVDLAPHINSFEDTAAIISHLDLVISVDTAVAHLCGALGKKCWVLLPDYKTDWRWLKERSDTPWYPDTLRLFRQGQGAGWQEVVQEVKQALQRLIDLPDFGGVSG